MSISLTESEKVLEAAKAEAKRLGLAVSAAVVDSRGDFKAGFRMDGAGWFTADVCRGKAFASANFGVPSGDRHRRHEVTRRRVSPRLRLLERPGDHTHNSR